MTVKHMNMKRVIRRCLEEVNATRKIARITSWSGALNTFLTKLDIQAMNRNGFKEPVAVRKRLIKKHKTMIEYFEKTFASFCEKYDYDRPLPQSNGRYNECIWMCWWQGLDNAPDIVKRCMESVQRNAGRHELIIITEKNYKDYVSIPEWLEEKRKKGIVSRTHFSDVLRLSLLAEYGGLWLDATFFCTSNLDSYFNYPIWTIKRPEYSFCSVAAGHFATYSLLCNLENRWIFATIRDFVIQYWADNDILIDYLTFDYMIILAQRKDLRIGQAFANIVPNSPCCDELCKILGEPYDEAVWEEFKKNTDLFKLTWKQEFPKQKDGCDTFYVKLLNGTL